MTHRRYLSEDAAHHGASVTAREMRDWWPSSGSADSDVLPDLDMLRVRSRDLGRNNAMLSGAIQTQIDNIVGPVLRLAARPNARLLGWSESEAAAWARHVEALWRDYAESPTFSAAGDRDFHASTETMLRGALLSGDALALPLWLPDRAGTRWATAHQIVEGDRLSNPGDCMDTGTLRGGIETSRHGQPLAYHIRRSHPGDAIYRPQDVTWARVPAQTRWGRPRVIHLCDAQRPGQRRGVPIASTVMGALKLSGHYQLTELQASLVNAKIAAIIESTLDGQEIAQMFGAEPADLLEAYNGWRGNLDSGAFIQVPVGAKVGGFAPQRPATAYASFMKHIANEISVGMNMPGLLVTKDFSEVNFSSARAALLEAWRHFHGRRRWLTSRWCNQVYAVWLEEAVNRGLVEAPEFYAARNAYCGAQWIGVGHLPIDPVKTARANEIKLATNQTTLQAVYAEVGEDWEEAVAQRARERQHLASLGLVDSEILPVDVDDDENDENDDDDEDENNPPPQRPYE